VRTPLLLALIGLAITGGSALATADSTVLILDAAFTGDGPTARVLTAEPGQLRVEFRLPWLDVEQVDVDDQIYHALRIPGGGLTGQQGQPGLPTYSKLLAVPSGKSVSVRVVSSVTNNDSPVIGCCRYRAVIPACAPMKVSRVKSAINSPLPWCRSELRL